MRFHFPESKCFVLVVPSDRRAKYQYRSTRCALACLVDSFGWPGCVAPPRLGNPAPTSPPTPDARRAARTLRVHHSPNISTDMCSDTLLGRRIGLVYRLIYTMQFWEVLKSVSEL